MLLLSVCIVNWNTREHLRECLLSLEHNPPRGVSLEVIVVDNASKDGSSEMTVTHFPWVKLIHNGDNRGYAEGNNQAIRAAKGEYILLLNPDVVVHKDVLTRAIVYLQANPPVGVLAARLLSPDGTTQSSLRSFPDPIPVLCEYVGLSKLFPKSEFFGAYRMTYFDYSHAGEADQPMGSFLMITRKCLDDVGLMDTDFPIFFNEVDWCFRAKREKGWRIVYTPEVTVTHHGGASTKQVKAKMVEESHRSLIKFYEKHYKQSISPALYSLITRAVQMDEKRALRRVSHSESS